MPLLRLHPTAAGSTTAGSTPAGKRVADLLCAAAIGSQVAYPLLRGTALRRATVASVVLFAGAALTDLYHRGGPRAAAGALLVAGGTGLAAEAVGVRTGRPFGPYRYSGTLGPQVAGVPVVVPLAWTMVAVPSLHLGRRLGRDLPPGPARRVVTVGRAAWTLASWDLFLDPQMTAAGHWRFARPHPGLPGLPGIPLTNYGGWLLTSLVMTALLDRVLPPDRGDTSAVPAALLGWTWLGSTLGNLAFFRRPAVAGYGCVAMGLTVGPYLRLIARARRGR